VQEPTSRFGPRSAYLNGSRNRSANGRG
jgi:hypothetical protein